MRMVDLLIDDVERFGVVRYADRARVAFTIALGDVTAPDYVPDATADCIAAEYRARMAARA